MARAMLVLATLSGGLWGVGCDDEKAETQTQAKAVTEPAPKEPVVASRALTDITAPAPFVVYGGVDDLTKLVSVGDKLSSALAPGGPGMKDMLAPAVNDALGLKGDAGIAFDKPMRIALVDPKAHSQNPVVILLSTKGAAAFEAALPADKKKDDEGNALSWTAKGNKLYGNFLGDVLVVTPDKGLFAAHKGFFAELDKAQLPGGQGAVVHVANMVALYGKELDEGIAMMKSQMSQPMPGGPNASALAGASQMFTWLGETTRELDKVLVGGTLGEEGMALRFTLFPKADSDVDKAFRSIQPGGDALLAKLPASTPAFLSVSIDPAAIPKLEGFMRWAMSLGFSGADQSEELLKASMEYWKYSTGEFTIAAVPIEGNDGLQIVAVTGVTDADKARETQRALSERYSSPESAKSLEALGVKMKYKKAAYKVNGVEVDTSVTKLTGDAAANPAMAMMEDFMSTHVATTDGWSVLAYGKDGKKTLEAFLGGKLEGGLSSAPGVARATKNAADGRFMLVYLSAANVAKRLAPKDSAMPAPPEGPGLALSAGAKDGKLHVTFDLPATELAGVMMLLQQAQTAMFGSMGGMPVAPPPGAAPSIPPAPQRGGKEQLSF